MEKLYSSPLQNSHFRRFKKMRAEVVELKKLNIDKDYQRDLRAHRVNEIAEGWDTAAAGTIIVSQRSNGKFWLVDGQHRVAAAQLAGEKELPAIIYEDLAPKAEANLRLHLNHRLQERPLERFKARLKAGDETAMDIRDLLEKHGTAINTTYDYDEGLNTVASIETVYMQDDGALLGQVLDILKKVYGKITPEIATSNSIKGVAWFLRAHPEADVDRLVEMLRRLSRAQLASMARTHMGVMRGSLWANYYRAIVEAYNFNLSPTKRLAWKVRGQYSKHGMEDSRAKHDDE